MGKATCMYLNLIQFSLGVTVSMATNGYTFFENSSTVEVCAEIVVPADGLECDVVSTLTFSDGSEASKIACFSFSCQLYFILFGFPSYTVRDMDYSISSPADTLTVTFSAGSTVSGTTACADVTIIDDDTVEGNHSFTVHVTGLELDPGGVYSELRTGTPVYATVNIIDNDGKMLLKDETYRAVLCHAVVVYILHVLVILKLVIYILYIYSIITLQSVKIAGE